MSLPHKSYGMNLVLPTCRWGLENSWHFNGIPTTEITFLGGKGSFGKQQYTLLRFLLSANPAFSSLSTPQEFPNPELATLVGSRGFFQSRKGKVHRFLTSTADPPRCSICCSWGPTDTPSPTAAFQAAMESAKELLLLLRIQPYTHTYKNCKQNLYFGCEQNSVANKIYTSADKTSTIFYGFRNFVTFHNSLIVNCALIGAAHVNTPFAVKA